MVALIPVALILMKANGLDVPAACWIVYGLWVLAELVHACVLGYDEANSDE